MGLLMCYHYQHMMFCLYLYDAKNNAEIIFSGNKPNQNKTKK